MDFSSIFASKGARYKKVAKNSNYNEPIPADGAPHGNSRIWGDASDAVQEDVIDATIAACNDQKLSIHDTAYVLAIMLVESGFNPDAAAGSTSASGLGQFVKAEGSTFGITDANRFNISANINATIDEYLVLKKKAQQLGKPDSWIYKWHHDGWYNNKANTLGMDISTSTVMPDVAKIQAILESGASPVQALSRETSGLSLASISSVVACSGGDPLLLDLGDGIQTTEIGSGAHFDYANNGFAEATGWASSTTGILVYDPFDVEYVDNGTELVGNSLTLPDGNTAPNGFAALQALAGQGVTVLDSTSPVWQYLKVWIGGDGTPGSGTLESLDELGIASINLNATVVSQGEDENGAIENLVSTFTLTNGTTRTIADYTFSVDSVDTWEPPAQTLSSTVLDLPEIVASGTVLDLRQAMQQNSTLTALVQQAVSATDFGNLQALITQILTEWTGANEVTPNSATDFMDARQEYVVEQFRGSLFTAEAVASLNANGNAAEIISSTYRQIYAYVLGAIVAQGSLNTLWTGGQFTISDTSDADTEAISPPNFKTALSYFASLLSTDAGAAANQLAMFGEALNGLGYTTTPGYSDFKSTILAQAPDLGQILSSFDGTRSIPIEMGTNATSTILSGANTGGFLFGFSGDDSFKSSGGNVLEDFGTGGNDTYEVSNGDVIKDGRGLGSVWFNGDKLTGGQWNPTTNQFESEDFDYQVVNGGALRVISVADPSQSITIDNVPLTQNTDGSYSITNGTYLGINLTDPGQQASIATYDISQNAGYTQTLVQGIQHSIDYGVWTPDGLNVLQPEGQYTQYNLDLTDLNLNQIYIQKDTASYNPQYYANTTGYDYDIYIKGAYTSNGYDDLWVRMIDGADPSGTDPVLDSITFADGETFTLGQLLAMPQIGLPVDPTVQVTGSQSTIAQAGINANYQVGALSSNVELTGFESTAASTDQLSFTNAVSSAKLSFSQSGNDLLVTNLLTGSVLQLDNYLSPNTDPSVAKSIQFGDGTSLTYQALIAQLENGTTPTINAGADLLQLTSTYENGDGTYSMDLTGAEAYIDNLIATNDPSALTMLSQFAQALQPLEQQGLIDYSAFREHYVEEGQRYAWLLDTGTDPLPASMLYPMQVGAPGVWEPNLAGNVWLNGNSVSSYFQQTYPLTLYGNTGETNLTDTGGGALTVVAGSGSMTLNASANIGSSSFDGGTGDNAFYGGVGANYFAAHGGNDVDYGGRGANTYYLAAGFGTVDIVNASRNTGSAIRDVIEFDSSLTEDDVSFTHVGNDLVITDDYGDQALVQGYFAAPDANGNAQTVSTIKFSDGTTLAPADVAEWTDISTQTSSSVISAPVDDPGSTLIAWGSGSTLLGGSGDDSLIGGAGNDTLIAGTGNDYMAGKEGANTYVFGPNIGNDVIDNENALGFGTDTIQFADGITADQVSFSKSGDDLVISVAGCAGSITVKRFFDDSVVLSSSPLISNIVFGDGSTWSSQQLFAQLQVATNQQPEAWGLDVGTYYGADWGTIISSSVSATGANVKLYGGDGSTNTIDAGTSENAQLFGSVGAESNGQDSVNNTFYTRDANTETYIGEQGQTGQSSNVINFGAGNNDVYVNAGDGYVATVNLDTSGGENELDFGSGITFLNLMSGRAGYYNTAFQASGVYVDFEWGNTVNTRLGDGVRLKFADGHVVDETFFQTWQQGWASVQYGIATSGQQETLVSNSSTNALFAGNGEETLESTAYYTAMFGGSGDNYFFGNVNGLYSGGSGNNYVYAGTGGSTIDGGLGTSDIYLNSNSSSSALVQVDLGGGNDTIQLGQGSAVVQFGDAISLSNLSFTTDSAGDLVIAISTTGQTVTLANWFNQQVTPSLSFAFHDGSSLSYAQVDQLLPQSGAAGNVTINAMPGTTDLFAGSGNDTLNSSYGGSETIETGPGSDTVNINGGSHVITVGTGQTTINNDAWSGGSESLVVGQDSGNVVCHDQTNGQSPLTIEFGAGITESEVSSALLYDLLTFVGPTTTGGSEPTANLTLAIAGGPTVEIAPAIQPNTGPDLPTIDFADGTTWTPQQLQAMLTTPLSGSDVANVEAGTNSAVTNGTSPTFAATDTQALFSYADSDIVFGSSSLQALVANQGHAILQANGGNTDIIAYAPENWTYNSTTQSYTMTESPDIVDGGSGNSTITMTDGVALAQKGNSNITLEGASNVLLYDTLDGVDTVQDWSQSLTVSLGGGLSWNDVSLEQDGNDLVLDVGSSGKIDLQNYYQNPGASVQLQMFEGSDSNGIHAETVSLASVVAAFTAAGPQSAPWSLDSALSNLTLTAETNQAYGGDIAAYYALNATLGGMSTDTAQAVLKDPAFGTAQTLTNPTQWQNGRYQLLAA